MFNMRAKPIYLTVLLLAMAFAAYAEMKVLYPTVNGHGWVNLWEGHHLVVFECYQDGLANCADVFDAAGKMLYQVDIRELSLNPNPRLDAVDVAPDGSAALGIGRKFQWDGYIAIISPAGSLRRTIGTGRYQPERISIAPDGSIWTFGSQGADMPRDEEDKQDYSTVRHYSAGGKLLSESVPRSTFPGAFPPATFTNRRVVGQPFIAAYTDSVSVLSESAGVYVELDAAGRIVSQQEVPDVPGQAQCHAKHVGPAKWYAACVAASSNAHTLFRLGKDGWQAVASGTGSGGILIGSDGDELVFGESTGSGYEIRGHKVVTLRE